MNGEEGWGHIRGISTTGMGMGRDANGEDLEGEPIGPGVADQATKQAETIAKGATK